MTPSVFSIRRLLQQSIMRQQLSRGTTLEEAAFEEEETNNESDAIGENDV